MDISISEYLKKYAVKNRDKLLGNLHSHRSTCTVWPRSVSLRARGTDSILSPRPPPSFSRKTELVQCGATRTSGRRKQRRVSFLVLCVDGDARGGQQYLHHLRATQYGRPVQGRQFELVLFVDVDARGGQQQLHCIRVKLQLQLL